MKKIFIFGIASELIYLSFYAVEPIRRYLNEPRLVLRTGWVFGILLALLFINLLFYMYAYRLVKQGGINLKVIIFFFVLFNLTLLLLWPIASVDIFSYISWGRVWSHHGANPYLVAYVDLPDDTFYDLLKHKWLSWPSPYGPVFMLISGGLTWLGGDILWLQLFLFKLFFVLLNLFSGFLVHKTFNNINVTFLYAWNPLLLFEFAANGHSDALTVCLMLLGIYCLLRRRSSKSPELSGCLVGGWICLILSALVKYVTLAVLPVFWLIFMLTIKSGRGRVIFAGLTALLSVLITALLFVPFWQSADTLSALLFYLKSPLVGLKFFGGLPAIGTIIIMYLIHFIPSIDYYYWASAISPLLFTAALICILAYITFKRRRIKPDHALPYSALALALFLALIPAWMFPWYFTTLIVLMICSTAVSKRTFDEYEFAVTYACLMLYTVVR